MQSVGLISFGASRIVDVGFLLEVVVELVLKVLVDSDAFFRMLLVAHIGLSSLGSFEGIRSLSLDVFVVVVTVVVVVPVFPFVIGLDLVGLTLR